MSVIRRPSSSGGECRTSAALGLSENQTIRPRTSETHAGMKPHNTSAGMPDVPGDTMSHLKAQRAVAREERGLGCDENDDTQFGQDVFSVPAHAAAANTTTHAPVFQPPERAASYMYAEPSGRYDTTYAGLEYTSKQSDADAFGDDNAFTNDSRGRFQRKPPPFERPKHPSLGLTQTASMVRSSRESFQDKQQETFQETPAAHQTGPPADEFTAQRAGIAAPPPAAFVQNPVPAPTVPTVPVHEVAALVAAAVAGEPPRALVSAKGATAAAMASVSETVRRAVTDARREGATMGAAEARLALQRSATKTEKAARAASAVAEANALEADENRRVAEVKRRVAEEQLEMYKRANEKNKSDAKRNGYKTVSEGKLLEKNKALRARAEAVKTEHAALRQALTREKQRADDFELKLVSREVARDAEVARARRVEKMALESAHLCDLKVAAATETLASERALARDTRAAYELIITETRDVASRALMALRQESDLLASDARDGVRTAAVDFGDIKRLANETSTAVAKGTRRRLASGLKRAAAAEIRAEELDIWAVEAETRARRAEVKAREAEIRAGSADAKIADAKKRADIDRAKANDATAKLAALASSCEADRLLTAEVTQQRDDALASALKAADAARRDAENASVSAQSAESDAEAAWAAAAEAERELEIASARRREADVSGFANRIKALRSRYFSSDSTKNDVQQKLDVTGLVEAMLDFKNRRKETSPAGVGDFGEAEKAESVCRLELLKLEECVLVTLSGNAMKGVATETRKQHTRPYDDGGKRGANDNDDDLLESLFFVTSR